MTHAGAAWTVERVERLRKLWGEGLSASQIAAEIGGISRNAVIGKVHRLGLSRRGKAKASPAHQAADGDPSSQARPGAFGAPALESAGVPRAADEMGIPLSERVTIMDLRDTMCRWPMGDPTKPEFRFCGARSVAGIPYCPHHASVAYQPMADRKRDRRLLRA